MWYNFREKALYCYENETTGEIKWEYPDVETTEEPTNDGNDATVVADMDTDDMDISPVTSPSPIEHNDLPTTFNQNNGMFQKKKLFKNVI